MSNLTPYKLIQLRSWINFNDDNLMLKAAQQGNEAAHRLLLTKDISFNVALALMEHGSLYVKEDLVGREWGSEEKNEEIDALFVKLTRSEIPFLCSREASRFSL